MHDVLRFWLDRGVDGFRADVVHLIGKDPALPDIPETDIVGSHLDVVGTHDYPGRTRCCGGSARCSTSIPATA